MIERGSFLASCYRRKHTFQYKKYRPITFCCDGGISCNLYHILDVHIRHLSTIYKYIPTTEYNVNKYYVEMYSHCSYTVRYSIENIICELYCSDYRHIITRHIDQDKIPNRYVNIINLINSNEYLLPWIIEKFAENDKNLLKLIDISGLNYTVMLVLTPLCSKDMLSLIMDYIFRISKHRFNSENIGMLVY